MDYFQLFGLQPRFEIDQQQLRKAFITKSRNSHPDFHLNSTQSLENMTVMSSEINKAYAILKDQHSRWQYIIDKFAETEFLKELDPIFLMEMMDYNEELMALEMEPNEESIKNLTTKMTSMLDAMQTQAEQEIEANGEDSYTQELLQRIHQYLLKRNYLLRIQEKLDKFATR